jgi:hypothetical protein
MTSRLVRTAIVAMMAAVFAGSSVDAAPARKAAPVRTAFDGNWSVVIVTQSGRCDRAYRFGIQIRDGNVVYDGGGVSLAGRVASNGSVRVSVAAGGQRADGTGRLARNYGGGSWRGDGSMGDCAGTWSAERR